MMFGWVGRFFLLCGIVRGYVEYLLYVRKFGGFGLKRFVFVLLCFL